MIALSTLIEILKKENPGLDCWANRSSTYEVMPATFYHYGEQLFSVPKQWIYERTSKNEDGSIKHRGWREIIRKLAERGWVEEKRVTKKILKSEAGLVVC